MRPHTVSTYERALNMLEARARSIAELRRGLTRKGEPVPDVELAIQRLVSAGLLDDATFARQFVRSKALGPGLSRRRLQQELGRRGVARTIADAAIAEVFDDEAIDVRATIERVARKKLRTLATFDASTQRRRLYAFLARRGYDSDDVLRALREVGLGDG